jgi:hypothetical protein
MSQCPNCGYDAENVLKIKPLTNAMSEYFDEKGVSVGIYPAEDDTIVVKGSTFYKKGYKVPSKSAGGDLVNQNKQNLPTAVPTVVTGQTAPSGSANATAPTQQKV